MHRERKAMSWGRMSAHADNRFVRPAVKADERGWVRRTGTGTKYKRCCYET